MRLSRGVCDASYFMVLFVGIRIDFSVIIRVLLFILDVISFL